MDVVEKIDVSAFAAPKKWHSVGQLIATVVPLLGLWWLMAEAAHVSWAIVAVLVLPATGLRMRAMLLQHDCGHRSLFGSARANDAVGLALGVLSWAPFNYWRRTHAQHHVDSSRLEGREELGSIMTLTVNEYDALTPGRKMLYRLYRNPFFLCGFGGPFQFLIKHRFPWDTPKRWRREWLSVLVTDLALAAVVWLLARHYGLRTVLAVELPVMVLSSAAAVWLIYIQHVFPGGYFVAGAGWNQKDASLRGSSYYRLPALLAWCTADVGLHQVHHYGQKIPNYRLRECFDAIEAFHVMPLSLRDSLKCWALKLWDEESGQFVAFPAAARLLEAAHHDS